MILSLVLGSAGGMLAHKIKIPAGLLLGALIVTIVLYSTFDFEPYPRLLNIIIQVASGITIGASVTRQQFIKFKMLFVPGLILVFGMIVLNLLAGFILHFLMGLDIATALLASAPGGFTEMSLVASSMGADVGLVAMLQLLRFIFVITFIPFILKKLNKNNSLDVKQKSIDTLVGNGNFTQKKPGKLMVTALIGLGAGLIGYLTPIPAGALTLSLVATSTYNILSNQGKVHPKQREVAQVLSGIYIGSRFVISQEMLQPTVLLIVFVFIVSITLCSLMIGVVLHKLSSMTLPTAILSSMPGGVSALGLIADELGAEPAVVSLMQLTRLISVIIFFPSIIQWVASCLV